MQRNLYLNAMVVLSAISLTTAVYAESDLNMAKVAQNPLNINPEAKHITLPMVYYNNFQYGPHNNTDLAFELKPVLPYSFTPSYDLIVRTIIPVFHQPGSNGYDNGLGDINPTVFLAPARTGVFTWGVGPTMIMPTATNNALGAGKWSVGPELALIAMPEQWTFAILTYNAWSIGGQSTKPNVNEFSFQYFVTYNLPKNWYVTTQPTLTANWMAITGGVWTVPFGAGVGRMFRLDQQHSINCAMQAYYNVTRPTSSNRWTLQFNLEFVFPDKRII